MKLRADFPKPSHFWFLEPPRQEQEAKRPPKGSPMGGQGGAKMAKGGGGENLPLGIVWAHAVGNVTSRPLMVPRDTPKLPQCWKKEVRGLRNYSYWHLFPSFVGGLNGHLALPPQDEGFGPKHMTS